MPLAAKEIMEIGKNTSIKAGINTNIPFEREIAVAVRNAIAFIISEVSAETYESEYEEPSGDLIIPDEKLIELLANIENMMTEIDISEALSKILTKRDLKAFLLFTNLFTASDDLSDNDKKIKIIREIIPILSDDSVLWNVILAFLNDGDTSAEMKKIIAEKGGNLEKTKKPDSVETFIRLFRAEIQRHIGQPVQA